MKYYSVFRKNSHIQLFDSLIQETMKEWYATLRLPWILPKNYFPVKLRIYLGEQLVCGRNEEPEVFAQRVS